MKKALIIGGRGKVGSYLVPMLAEDGYHVVNVSRGTKQPYVENKAWDSVEQLTLDRSKAGFEEKIVSVGADVVIDMICFEASDMAKLIDALEGKVSHYLVCGSVWMHGRSNEVPVLEHECREPLDHYGIEKDKIDKMITARFQKTGFPGTAVHPGHIVCPGDVPVNPQGFKGNETFEALRDGKPLLLANFGMETVHHVHASDVAGVFFAAIKAGKPAFGEGFHAVSPRAVTLRGYAEEAASWFGKTAKLEFLPYDEWKTKGFDEEQQFFTWDHAQHSPSASMQKAKELLGFAPKYTSYEAIKECLRSFGFSV